MIGIIIGVFFIWLGIGYVITLPSNELVTNENEIPLNTGLDTEILVHTQQPIQIDQQKGYSILEITDDVYWLVSNGYQTMFLVTNEGVIVVDAPQPIGERYIQAIREVTDKPITYMIYSHHHPDHTGAAGSIFPSDIEYIA